MRAWLLQSDTRVTQEAKATDYFARSSVKNFSP